MVLSLPIPDQACAYEHYDPETLVPTNTSTYVRLMELGWTSETFQGRSVLDIGCNTGSLSLHALNLGASSVKSVDVQVPLVDFFTSVVAEKKLPITVERKAFNDLDPAEDAADVVLFMEVLHWIVDQGGTIPDAIAQLASLTRETLYLETPWDVAEPSIARKGIITEEMYNIETILRELSRHFRDVRTDRFMTYFGRMANSKRILIRASGRRTASLPLSGKEGINQLDISLRRGANNIELVTSPGGVAVLKKLPPSSPLAKLPTDMATKLGQFLNGIKDPVCVAPINVDGEYRFDTPDGSYMMFPFVGDLGDHFPTPRTPAAPNDPMSLIVKLREQLAKAPANLVDGLRSITNPFPILDLDAVDFDGIEIPDDIMQEARACMERMKDYDRAQEDTLVHNDLQTGNMIPNDTGDRIIDIDLMRSGTGYTDFLIAAALNHGVPDDLSPYLDELERINGRGISRFDVDAAVCHVFSWVNAVLRSEKGPSDRQRSTVSDGLARILVLAP